MSQIRLDLKKIKESSKTPNKSNKKKKNKNEMTLKPITPFFLFCSKYREEQKKINKDKKLSAKELGIIWKGLSIEEKKLYFEKYKEKKEKYQKLKKENIKKEDDKKESLSKSKSKNKKIKVTPDKIDIINNNKKACNCGKCDDCKKRIKKKIFENY